MILLDTSVWIDHLRIADKYLIGLLENGGVLAHPFITGELAMGSLKNRQVLLGDLNDLPRAIVATDSEVLHLVSTRSLFGHGLSYVDAHLLAACQLTPDARLWTRDKRLHGAATALSLQFTPPHPN